MLGFAQELFHIGHAKYENTSKTSGSYQASSIETEVDKQFTSRSSTLGQTPTQSHLDAIRVVGMEGARKKTLKFHQTINGCVFGFDMTPKEYIKNVIHIWDRAQIQMPAVAVQLHTYRRKVSLLCQGHRRGYPAGGNSTRRRSSTHTSGHSLFTNRRKLATADRGALSSCRVEIKYGRYLATHPSVVR